jgi:hypothetical protein
MHLGNGGGCQRLFVEPGENFVHQTACRPSTMALPRRRETAARDPAALASSSAMSGGRRSRRVDSGLAELDEDRPQFLEGEADALAERAALALEPRGGDSRKTHSAAAAEQVGGEDDLVEPVPHQHAWICSSR